ncbi:heterokaryon incompatibility protein-domain-containing protein [Paraphoma chrysanthemicola]|nr:heterokaryon incompatibility protein-domain-containing protein [Paraphoma chrysanthemicola]
MLTSSKSPKEKVGLEGPNEGVAKDPNVINGACKACRDFIGSDRNRASMLRAKDGLHSISYIKKVHQLNASASAGCVICKCFRDLDRQRGVQKKLEYYTRHGIKWTDERYYNFRFESMDSHAITVEGQWDEWFHGLEYTVHLYITAAKDDPASQLYCTRPANVDVGSTRAFDWGRARLHECIANHEQCRQHANLKPDAAPLPKRLLHIERQAGSVIVRLHISKPSETGSYLALSYCWGGEQEHSTTTRNIDQYVSQIPISTIPRTILDAIHVTWELGFTHLWVDSYCILQDSSKDKESEISHMASVYKNAVLTILASSAQTCREGFLEDRSTQSRRSREARCIIPLKNDSGQPAGNIGLEISWHRWHPPGIGLENDALNQRGWALQENLLSTRKLAYGEDRLMWRCKTELKADGGHILHADFGAWPTLPSTSDGDNVGIDRYSKDKVVPNFWISTVEMYSKKKLSVAEDKFPAVSAAASRLHDITGWTYVAGLWFERLIQSLAWERDPSYFTLSPSVNRWRAPSWSWACLDDPISYGKIPIWNKESLSAEVISCTTDLLHKSSPFGQIRKAEIVLRGPLYPVTFVKGGKLSVKDVKSADGTKVHNWSATWTADQSAPMYNLFPPTFQQKFARSTNADLRTFLESGQRSKSAKRKNACIAWCLELGIAFVGVKDWPEDYYPTIGLVLVKTSRDCYQRIGLFEGPGRPNWSDYVFEEHGRTSAPSATVKII